MGVDDPLRAAQPDRAGQLIVADDLLERFTVIIVRTPDPDLGPLATMKDHEAIEKQKADQFAALALQCDLVARPELAALCRRMVAEQERQARMMSGQPLPGEPPGLVELPWWWHAILRFLVGSPFRDFGLVDAIVYLWVIYSVVTTLRG